MGNTVPMASSLSQPSALPEPMELSELPPVHIVSIQDIEFDTNWKKIE